MSAEVDVFLVTYSLGLRITDGEVRPKVYARGEYRVNFVSLDWHFRDGEWSTGRVQLGGAVLKKDGTDSLNQHSESVWGAPSAWVADLIKAHAPTFIPTLGQPS